MATKGKYQELTGKPFDPPQPAPEKKAKGPAKTPAPERPAGEKSKKVPCGIFFFVLFLQRSSKEAITIDMPIMGTPGKHWGPG